MKTTTYAAMSTTDLLLAASEITASLDHWSADERASISDPDLATIVEALESRGYDRTWQTWVETGTWSADRH